MSGITNTTYFRIVEAHIRKAMQAFEITYLLPIARNAIKETGIKVKEFPIEGYYGKSPELIELFNIIKTFQQPQKPLVTPSIELLHEFFTEEVFGNYQVFPNAIGKEAFFTSDKPVIISTMADPITFAITFLLFSPKTRKLGARELLTIENIFSVAKESLKDLSLVGLGIMVDEANFKRTNKLNPQCSLLAIETTAMQAHVKTTKRATNWEVDKNIFDRGNKIIAAYNYLFSKWESAIRIPFITPDNAFNYVEDMAPMRRCVCLHKENLAGLKDYYHWALDGEGKVVKEFWHAEVVTTAMYLANPYRF